MTFWMHGQNTVYPKSGLNVCMRTRLIPGSPPRAGRLALIIIDILSQIQRWGGGGGGGVGGVHTEVI